jgi:hypothetical protein
LKEGLLMFDISTLGKTNPQSWDIEEVLIHMLQDMGDSQGWHKQSLMDEVSLVVAPEGSPRSLISETNLKVAEALVSLVKDGRVVKTENGFLVPCFARLALG